MRTLLLLLCGLSLALGASSFLQVDLFTNSSCTTTSFNVQEAFTADLCLEGHHPPGSYDIVTLEGTDNFTLSSCSDPECQFNCTLVARLPLSTCVAGPHGGYMIAKSAEFFPIPALVGLQSLVYSQDSNCTLPVAGRYTGGCAPAPDGTYLRLDSCTDVEAISTRCVDPTCSSCSTDTIVTELNFCNNGTETLCNLPTPTPAPSPTPIPATYVKLSTLAFDNATQECSGAHLDLHEVLLDYCFPYPSRNGTMIIREEPPTVAKISYCDSAICTNCTVTQTLTVGGPCAQVLDSPVYQRPVGDVLVGLGPLTPISTLPNNTVYYTTHDALDCSDPPLTELYTLSTSNGPNCLFSTLLSCRADGIYQIANCSDLACTHCDAEPTPFVRYPYGCSLPSFNFGCTGVVTPTPAPSPVKPLYAQFEKSVFDVKTHTCPAEAYLLEVYSLDYCYPDPGRGNTSSIIFKSFGDSPVYGYLCDNIDCSDCTTIKVFDLDKPCQPLSSNSTGLTFVSYGVPSAIPANTISIIESDSADCNGTLISASYFGECSNRTLRSCESDGIYLVGTCKDDACSDCALHPPVLEYRYGCVYGFSIACAEHQPTPVPTPMPFTPTAKPVTSGTSTLSTSTTSDASLGFEIVPALFLLALLAL